MTARKLHWDGDDVFAFLRAEFPQAFLGGRQYGLRTLRPGKVEIACLAGHDQLRPGGTVSGPAQMELVDFSVYFLLLAHLGEKARLAVTTSFHCSFLRKPEPGELVCRITMLKFGRTLAVADARILASGGKPVLHGEATYYVGAA